MSIVLTSNGRVARGVFEIEPPDLSARCLTRCWSLLRILYAPFKSVLSGLENGSETGELRATTWSTGTKAASAIKGESVASKNMSGERKKIPIGGFSRGWKVDNEVCCSYHWRTLPFKEVEPFLSCVRGSPLSIPDLLLYLPSPISSNSMRRDVKRAQLR